MISERLIVPYRDLVLHTRCVLQANQVTEYEINEGSSLENAPALSKELELDPWYLP
jgi:hypothetical protein